VRDEQDRPREGLHRLLQLLDGGQVEMVRRLVQDEQVDAPRLQERQRSPGERVAAGRVGLSPSSANFASSVRPSSGESPAVSANIRARGSGESNSSLAWSTSPTTTPLPRLARPEPGVRRPRIAASSVVLPDPFAPVSTTRSP
jgi:hypothetical protein